MGSDQWSAASGQRFAQGRDRLKTNYGTIVRRTGIIICTLQQRFFGKAELLCPVLQSSTSPLLLFPPQRQRPVVGDPGAAST
jgi:hypothetical protein